MNTRASSSFHQYKNKTDNMGSFEFDKCCFCIDLKTGCFVIGYFSLVCYIIMAIMSIVGLAAGGVIIADKEAPEDQNAGILILAVSGVILLFTVVLLTFIIVLLVGLHKNKPGHVKAYLIYACVYVSITVMIFIANVAASRVKIDSVAQNIFSILLSIYFILVIRSQYLVMKRPERGPAIYNSA